MGPRWAHAAERPGHRETRGWGALDQRPGGAGRWGRGVHVLVELVCTEPGRHGGLLQGPADAIVVGGLAVPAVLDAGAVVFKVCAGRGWGGGCFNVHVRVTHRSPATVAAARRQGRGGSLRGCSRATLDGGSGVRLVRVSWRRCPLALLFRGVGRRGQDAVDCLLARDRFDVVPAVLAAWCGATNGQPPRAPTSVRAGVGTLWSRDRSPAS